MSIINDITSGSGGGGGGSFTAGGDLSGTSSSQQVINITGAAGVATVSPSTTLNFGTNPSTAGIINLPNNTRIAARNAANSADITLLRVDGSNNISLGGGANDGYVALNASSGNLVKFQVNSVDSVTVSNNTISLAQPGTAYTISQPAQTSDVLPNVLTIQAQQPFASATVNKSPAGITLALGSEVGGGVPASKVTITADSTNLFAFGGDPLSGTLPMMWMGQASPTSSNHTLLQQSGNLTINAATSIILDINATVNLTLTAGAFNWSAAATTPVIGQTTVATNSATGTSLTIQAQSASGTTSVGGALNLSSGSGTSTNGKVNMQVAGTTQLAFSPTSLQPAQSAIALTATTITLSAAQQKTPSLVFSGTPGAGTCTIALNGVVGMYWLDFSQVTLGATAYIITNGAGSYTATTLLGTKTMLCVVANTVSTLSVG
jgi:hypothetical protein